MVNKGMYRETRVRRQAAEDYLIKHQKSNQIKYVGS
jgi:hypothetical protein